MSQAAPAPQEPLRGLPGWLVLLAALTAIAPLSIDMYLPAFPAIAQELGAEQSAVQLTLAAFFIGLALGQLFYGPLSDHSGRKPPLYVGLGLYFVASLACAFATDVHMLMGLRFLQALGGCAGIVIARAVIRDRCDARGAAQAFSLVMLVMGAAPILAPLLGGLLLSALGWRAIFGVLAAFSAICLLALHWYMRDGYRPPGTPLRLRGVLSDYAGLLRDRQFISLAACGGLAQAGMFAYIAGSPFVLIELHGIPAEHYGWVFGANAFGLIAASQLNARLVRRHGIARLLGVALWLPATLSVVALVLASAGFGGLPLLLGAFFGYLTGLGAITPNSSALALAEQGERAGTASALMGTLQFGLGTTAAIAVSLGSHASALPLLVVMALCGCGALALYWLVARRDLASRNL